MIDNDMLNDFHIEADELFAQSEESLLDLENSGDFKSNYNKIFRAFHSVKGAAGMFGLDRLQEHIHFLENLFDKRKNESNLSPQTIDYLLSGVDSARKILLNEKVDFKYFDSDLEAIPSSSITKSDQGQIIDSKLKESIKAIVKKRSIDTEYNGLIYVVDDEKDILEITQSHLESEGYNVKTFLSAELALDSLKKESPDAIITDINMPHMNGIEFMRHVNKLKPHLPTIVVSGFVTKEVCMESLACGVAGVLEKPYDLDIFNSTVSIAVDRYRAFKLLNSSVDLLVYQFEGFDKYLAENKMETQRDNLRSELKNILKQKKILIERVRSLWIHQNIKLFMWMMT